MTQVQKDKLSNYRKGLKASIETKQKLKEQRQNLHWFTNGILDKFVKTCPIGFYPGRSKMKAELNSMYGKHHSLSSKRLMGPRKHQIQ